MNPQFPRSRSRSTCQFAGTSCDLNQSPRFLGGTHPRTPSRLLPLPITPADEGTTAKVAVRSHFNCDLRGIP